MLSRQSAAVDDGRGRDAALVLSNPAITPRGGPDSVLQLDALLPAQGEHGAGAAGLDQVGGTIAPPEGLRPSEVVFRGGELTFPALAPSLRPVVDGADRSDFPVDRQHGHCDDPFDALSTG